MAAIVVDSECVEALKHLKQWVDDLPLAVKEQYAPKDFDFDWIDSAIENNDGKGFIYQLNDPIILLNDVSEDEFGYQFKRGMRGRFSMLLNPRHCVITLASALVDSCGGMGDVEVICSLTDFTSAK